VCPGCDLAGRPGGAPSVAEDQEGLPTALEGQSTGTQPGRVLRLPLCDAANHCGTAHCSRLGDILAQ
jgi:hypothetical protein